MSVGCTRAFAVMTFLLSRAAHAAPPDGTAPDNRARAQELFDSALMDAMQGRVAEACPKFLASQRADPKTTTLLNLGNCYDKNGQTASAWGAFREAEQSARRAGRADWVTLAHDRAAQLEPKLVRLTIHVPPAGAIEGLVVTRDGAPIDRGEWDVAIPVDPGEHVVGADAPGHKPFRGRIAVKDRSQTMELPALEAGVAGPGPTPVVVVVPQSWWTGPRTAGAVVAGIGAAALITGGVLALVAKSNYDDALGQCNGPTACPPGKGIPERANSAFDLAGIATGTMIGGGAIAAAGLALLVFAPAPEQPSAKITVGRSGVMVSGAW